MTDQHEQQEQYERTSRVVEFKLPLHWLIGVASGVAFTLISMWFSLNTLVRTVGDLQIDVKAGNNSVVAVVGELALLKYRLTNAEARTDELAAAIKKIER